MFPGRCCFRQNLVFCVVIQFLFRFLEFRGAFELPILEKCAIGSSFRRGFLDFLASVGPQEDSLQHPRDALRADRFIVAGHGTCSALTDRVVRQDSVVWQHVNSKISTQ